SGGSGSRSVSPSIVFTPAPFTPSLAVPATLGTHRRPGSQRDRRHPRHRGRLPRPRRPSSQPAELALRPTLGKLPEPRPRAAKLLRQPLGQFRPQPHVHRDRAQPLSAPTPLLAIACAHETIFACALDLDKAGAIACAPFVANPNPQRAAFLPLT